MQPFEYVMVLVSIVVGLGVTHVLTAIGTAVHGLRGHGAAIRLDPVFLLWTVYVLAWLVSFWWFEYKYQEVIEDWSYGLYLFVILYAIVLFLIAVILVPERMEGVTDSYEYFMEGRAWFFGAFLVGNAIDIVDTIFKGAEFASNPAILVSAAIWTLVGIVGIVATRRMVQLGLAIFAVFLQLVYSFIVLGILGSW